MKIPPTLLYEKFTPVTPKKESCKNINRDTFEKTRFEILCSLLFLF